MSRVLGKEKAVGEKEKERKIRDIILLRFLKLWHAALGCNGDYPTFGVRN